MLCVPFRTWSVWAGVLNYYGDTQMTRILVIEDEEFNLENIMEILAMEDFEVQGARNGKAGVELALQFMPDLIVCDVAMPEMNGYDVLIELRNKEQMATVPFIFLTAKASRSDLRKGMDLGADEALTKRFSGQDLLVAIHAGLDKRRASAKAYSDRLDNLRESIIFALPHEFRTPLYGIVGYATLLMEDYENVTREEILNMSQRIFSSAERLNRLIENYLLYAQIELTFRDRERVAAMADSLTEQPSVLINAAAIQNAEAAQRREDLSFDVEDYAVRVSEESLTKIVEELVDNAFKFSDTGTPVTVAAHSDEHNYILTVTDKGRGMTADQIASVGAYMQFERKIHEQQGTGLGLTIARRLAELHGGHIVIESTPKRGTIVTVMLPLAS